MTESATRVSAGPQWSHWSRLIRGEQPCGDPAKLEIWGYTCKPSYGLGEEVSLHVSTTAARFDIVIYRDGAREEVVHQQHAIPGQWQETRARPYANGCGWEPATTLSLSEDWKPGAYVVEFKATDADLGATQDGFFVVRPPLPTQAKRIAVVLATYTWQAYNDWGGASSYSSDDQFVSAPDAETLDMASSQRSLEGFSPRLSFDRPWARGLIRLPVGAPRPLLKDAPPIGWAPRWEVAEWSLANGYSHWSGFTGWARHDGLFVRWAELNGYPIDLLTQWDLDQIPGCLDGYSCVVTVGHDEYWTASGRQELDQFVERGGSYARLAGNIFWQVRLEDEGRTQVCYKYVPERDPLAADEDRRLRTGAFESLIIGNPPVTTFGANGARGVYSRFGGFSPRGVGGFIVYRNDHWVFDGTDLYYADVFGSDVPLVGYEADGVSYTFTNGLPIPTGEDGTPSDLEILALTPVTLEEEDHGHAGTILVVGDGDLAFVARALYGADTPELRDKVRRGAAVMTFMRKGAGQVFAGGSTEWPYALSESNPVVERIVRNVLDRFSGAADG